jgi:hypothetical protein
MVPTLGLIGPRAKLRGQGILLRALRSRKLESRTFHRYSRVFLAKFRRLASARAVNVARHLARFAPAAARGMSASRDTSPLELIIVSPLARASTSLFATK